MSFLGPNAAQSGTLRAHGLGNGGILATVKNAANGEQIGDFIWIQKYSTDLGQSADLVTAQSLFAGQTIDGLKIGTNPFLPSSDYWHQTWVRNVTGTAIKLDTSLTYIVDTDPATTHLVGGGSGYTVGTTYNMDSSANPGQIQVLSVTGSAIHTYQIVAQGVYTSIPSSPATLPVGGAQIAFKVLPAGAGGFGPGDPTGVGVVFCSTSDPARIPVDNNWYPESGSVTVGPSQVDSQYPRTELLVQVINPGFGFANGDIVALTGPVDTPDVYKTEFTVTASGGAITSLSQNSKGVHIGPTSNNNLVSTSGPGTGATATFIDSAYMNRPETGYLNGMATCNSTGGASNGSTQRSRIRYFVSNSAPYIICETGFDFPGQLYIRQVGSGVASYGDIIEIPMCSIAASMPLVGGPRSYHSMNVVNVSIWWNMTTSDISTLAAAAGFVPHVITSW